MTKAKLELAVGFFVLLGIFSLTYLSIKLGKLEILGAKGYVVYAAFEQNGGLKVGASVQIAGVEIGTVKNIRLDNYQALVEMAIDEDIVIQEDAIASIKTKGLIGEKYVHITPGGSDTIIANKGRITETEPALDVESLISKYIFGKV